MKRISAGADARYVPARGAKFHLVEILRVSRGGKGKAVWGSGVHFQTAFRFDPSLHFIRHPEVRAQRASKDERPGIFGPSPFEARRFAARASG
jgi:hypothetical protein